MNRNPRPLTLTDHLYAAELPDEEFAAEQIRLARLRALRRALARTPHGDPKQKDY